MDELYHHGIKGQKWGVRRFQNEDGSLTSSGKERYSADQRLRDSKVYGKSGVRRIEKTINKTGVSVSGARSIESDRIRRTRRMATTNKKIGSVVGTIAGSLGGVAGSIALGKVLESKGFSLDTKYASMVTAGAVGAGGFIGSKLGKLTFKDATMLAGGYSPSKYCPEY